MKRKKLLEELQTKTVGELETTLQETKKELADVALKARVGQEGNVRHTQHLRRRISRIMTLLRTTSDRESIGVGTE